MYKRMVQAWCFVLKVIDIAWHRSVIRAQLVGNKLAASYHIGKAALAVICRPITAVHRCATLETAASRRTRDDGCEHGARLQQIRQDRRQRRVLRRWRLEQKEFEVVYRLSNLG